MLEQLGLLLEQEDRRSAHRADVDGLERGVQDEHTTTRPADAAAGIGSVPLVVFARHGPQWYWGYGAGHDPRGV
jgi:hypothetical protein